MNKLKIGWREWVDLPGLPLRGVKAKIDTGARTSALHAYDIEQFTTDGQDWVRFKTHPRRSQPASATVFCEMPLKDVREVTNSGGQREERCVIETPLSVGSLTWTVEVTLTDRSTMKFRMLLGRHALKGHFMINPGRSFLCGTYQQRYNKK